MREYFCYSCELIPAMFMCSCVHVFVRACAHVFVCSCVHVSMSMFMFISFHEGAQ